MVLIILHYIYMWKFFGKQIFKKFYLWLIFLCYSYCSSFMQYLKSTPHLQLLQNIGYIPCVVQYILVTYLTSNSLYLSLPHHSIAPPPFPTGNH